MLKKAMSVELDLKGMGYEVSVNIRADARWQCEIRRKRDVYATSVEDDWEQAIMVAADDLARQGVCEGCGCVRQVCPRINPKPPALACCPDCSHTLKIT